MARFASVDPGSAGATLAKPQSWNGYSYVINNPLTLIDNAGLCAGPPPESPDCVPFSLGDDNPAYAGCAGLWAAYRQELEAWQRRDEACNNPEPTPGDPGGGSRGGEDPNKQRLQRMNQKKRDLAHKTFDEHCMDALTAAGVWSMQLFRSRALGYNVLDGTQVHDSVYDVMSQSAAGQRQLDALPPDQLAAAKATPFSTFMTQQPRTPGLSAMAIPGVAIYVNPNVVRVQGPNRGRNVWDLRTDNSVSAAMLHELLHTFGEDVHSALEAHFGLPPGGSSEAITNALERVCF